jgi:hypothetical protein
MAQKTAVLKARFNCAGGRAGDAQRNLMAEVNRAFSAGAFSFHKSWGVAAG